MSYCLHNDPGRRESLDDFEARLGYPKPKHQSESPAEPAPELAKLPRGLRETLSLSALKKAKQKTVDNRREKA